MGRQIIKQPNGKYAQWSAMIDDFAMLDAMPEDIIEDLIADERERITKRVQEVCAALDAGGKPYYQFTRSWEDALDTIRRVHGGKSETWAILKELGLL